MQHCTSDIQGAQIFGFKRVYKESHFRRFPREPAAPFQSQRFGKCCLFRVSRGDFIGTLYLQEKLDLKPKPVTIKLDSSLFKKASRK